MNDFRMFLSSSVSALDALRMSKDEDVFWEKFGISERTFSFGQALTPIVVELESSCSNRRCSTINTHVLM